MSRETKRVPLDFDWPLKEKWAGYLNPFYRFRQECPECEGSGRSAEARRYGAEWYGNAHFDPAAYGAKPVPRDHPAIIANATRNVDHSPDFYQAERLGRDAAIAREARRLYHDCYANHWNHHLIQADVDALIAAGRLVDFTHTFVRGEGWKPIVPAPAVSPDEVNTWSMSGMGHDAINEHVCVKARCVREGVSLHCPRCRGEGESWPSNAHKALCEAYTNIEPPAGDGWQMWETTSEGSPISPVFGTPEELAAWLADTGASAFGGTTATYEQWLSAVMRGWSPSLVGVGADLKSGVEALA